MYVLLNFVFFFCFILILLFYSSVCSIMQKQELKHHKINVALDYLCYIRINNNDCIIVHCDIENIYFKISFASKRNEKLFYKRWTRHWAVLIIIRLLFLPDSTERNHKLRVTPFGGWIKLYNVHYYKKTFGLLPIPNRTKGKLSK